MCLGFLEAAGGEGFGVDAGFEDGGEVAFGGRGGSSG
jgi:hypothetical protein